MAAIEDIGPDRVVRLAVASALMVGILASGAASTEAVTEADLADASFRLADELLKRA